MRHPGSGKEDSEICHGSPCLATARNRYDTPVTTVFPDGEPGLATQVLWAWVASASVGLLAESIGVVMGGRLDLGPVGVAAVLVAPLVFPGLAGAGSAAALFWHPRARGFGRAAAVVVGCGMGGVVVGTTSWLVPTAPWPEPALPWLAASSVVATAGALALLARSRELAMALAAAPAVLSLAAGLPSWRATVGTAAGPTVVLVTVDGWRADRAGAHATDTSAFDRVAAEGVRFDLATSPIPSTGPAAASVLTGTMPWTHRSWLDGQAPSGPLVSERLAERGWHTAAFVSRPPLHRSAGLDRGFAVYDDDFAWAKGTRDLALGRVLGRVVGRRGERRAQATVDRALRWLGRHPDGAAFVWVHLGDPHGPYDPPPPYDERYYTGSDRRDPGRRLPAGLPEYHGPVLDGVTDPDYLIARYDGEVAYVDAQIGRLLDALDDRPGDELVAVVGLYGELLGEHDAWFRHDELYEPALHVPLAMRMPGTVEPGRTIDEPVEIRDLAPTLLEYALGEQSPSSWKRAIDLGLPAGRTARSVLPGAANRRPAVAIRGSRVRYLYLGGAVPVERAWTIVSGGKTDELPLTGKRRDMLRAEARALMADIPTP